MSSISVASLKLPLYHFPIKLKFFLGFCFSVLYSLYQEKCYLYFLYHPILYGMYFVLYSLHKSSKLATFSKLYPWVLDKIEI